MFWYLAIGMALIAMGAGLFLEKRRLLGPRGDWPPSLWYSFDAVAVLLAGLGCGLIGKALVGEA